MNFVVHPCQETKMTETALKRTPLYDEHVKLGGKMVPFAGYEMPVQYPTGVLTEHNWTREHAGLFDVSHMGQATIWNRDFETTARALEHLLPADLLGLKPTQQRYSQLLSRDGCILDDVMISHWPSYEGKNAFYVVVNASRKDADIAFLRANLPDTITITPMRNASLLALQGPRAATVLVSLIPEVESLKFMQCGKFSLEGMSVSISRSGYTGEDGFELSMTDRDVSKIWNLLLSDPEVKPIGLGARDSLRLEAGLCLYGHELDETISPVEADLVWSIGKRRRTEGGFIGAERVLKELAEGPKRKRVGIKPEGRAPAREGTIIKDMSGRDIGKITSGGFGPSVNGPVAMGYVETATSTPGTKVQLIVRDKALPAEIVKLPFVPARFKR
jgi:aminomethyltransferase